MSLINQMLQDLEKRRASGTERAALPNQVRVLPREESRRMPWWLMGVAAGAGLIAVLAWQINSRPAAQSSIAPEPVSANSAPAQLNGPASRLALDLEKVPPPRRPVTRVVAGAQSEPVKKEAASSRIAESPAAPVVATQSPPSKPPLATAAVIAAGSAAPAIAAAPPATAITAAVATAKPAAPAPKIVAVSPESKVQAAAANPQIEKRAQALTPQQLAENDYREAVSFLNQGRLADAEEGFRRALQHNPTHVGARQGLFGLLLDAKKNGEAEQVLQETLKLNPNQTGFATALASLQYERGDVAGAIETMQKSAPAAQASPDYLARLAGLLQRQSRHKEAVDYYQAALRLAPGSGVWLMGLGISLQALNRNSEAQEAFRRARATNTLNPQLQAFVDQRLKQLQ